jgi:hypothetical protein
MSLDKIVDIRTRGILSKIIEEAKNNKNYRDCKIEYFYEGEVNSSNNISLIEAKLVYDYPGTGIETTTHRFVKKDNGNVWFRYVNKRKGRTERT